MVRFLGIAVLSLVAGISLAQCPSGSVLLNSRCFYFSDDSFGYEDADKDCVSRNGYLASIHSDTDNAAIAQHAQSISMTLFWIGLNKMHKANFTWTDKTAFDYNNFDASLPDGCQYGPQNCVNFYGQSGTWYNCWPCNMLLPYVCEIAATSNNKTLPKEDISNKLENFQAGARFLRYKNKAHRLNLQPEKLDAHQ